MAYLTLFMTALAAATLLPAYSEILLGGMVTQGYSLWWIWFWATAGNTLGSVVNGVIGRQVDRFKHKRWFPVTENQLEKARTQFNRYGQWSLLMGWLPIGGDALTLVGGIMRVPWLNFVVLVGIGKGIRYALVIWLVLEASGVPGSP
ncbi:DedA family protein [Marinobacter panjinensis]|uniref:DedA family protein n=1 Tax=Marinobacter panjinensis TaxID=2576384 RepID=A0A4U6QTT6_9GAMM|nr:MULTISPECIES: YqaA family protein [Marinobacter]MCR8914830.1 DedA family protein [Marinobacter panjinensis]MDK8464573.1 YqaA family protein [Marinobacter sp. SS13-12]TKV64079.1 DedA family protein [Marinobacter panjinensis]